MAAEPSRGDRRRGVVDAALDELARRGIVTRPASPSKEPPPRRPVISLALLMRELDEERADRDWTVVRS
ncbi:MAG TPA: hypothetical protein VNB06_21485 [Thermoanaerobaculia bacterium]|nr:hypothetical protein [Thermoanaerobaculia bacterium]